MMSDYNFGDVTADVTAELGEVSLSDPDTEKPKPEQNFVGAPTDLAEAEAKARDYKWPEKVDYDYTTYAPRDDRTVAIEPSQAAPWASSAAKYEWLEEYGDVAPRIPELEAQLFDLEFLHRTGDNMRNLDLHVKMEGAVRIEPITKASSFRVRIDHNALLTCHQVLRSRSTPRRSRNSAIDALRSSHANSSVLHPGSHRRH
jgi:hypothetical protein